MKCNKCNYPYATKSKCPNCGAKNPQGAGCLSIIGLILFLWLFWGRSSSDDKNEIIKSSIKSQDSSGDDKKINKEELLYPPDTANSIDNKVLSDSISN